MDKRIKYLKRLLDVYLLFIKKWESYVLIHKNGKVHIVWLRMKEIKNDGEGICDYLDYTVRTFPEEDVPKMIISFREKIRREFRNRHAENPPYSIIQKGFIKPEITTKTINHEN